MLLRRYPYRIVISVRDEFRCHTPKDLNARDVVPAEVIKTAMVPGENICDDESRTIAC